MFIVHSLFLGVCAKPPRGTVVQKWLLASMAAAEGCINSATNSRFFAVDSGESGVSPQQQIALVFPPHFRQRGGAPRPSRRFCARIRPQNSPLSGAPRVSRRALAHTPTSIFALTATSALLDFVFD
jgi:hypothetical protein